MNAHSIARRLGAAFLGIALVLGVAHANESNKWRVQFSESAKSDGTITLEFAPEGESAFEVSVKIEDGTGENKVARTVASGLKAQLPEGHYHVEVDDGEDVLIKKEHGVPDFGLRIVTNSVESVRIDLDRE